MAIGTMTVTPKVDSPNKTLFCDAISFAGDASYAGAGLEGIQAALRARVGDQRAIIATVDAGANGGYVTKWDLAAGVLRVYQSPAVTIGASGGTQAAGVLTEVPTVSLAGVTFRLTVFSI